MPTPSQQTLENILLTSNAICIALHEDKNTKRNFALYIPMAERVMFMHGRDLLKPDAPFDDSGKLVIERDRNGGVVHHPFTDKAVETVEYYLSPESLEERKAMLALTCVPPELEEEKTIEALERKFPKSGINALYQEARAEQKAMREEAARDPEGFVKKEVAKALRIIEEEPKSAAIFIMFLQGFLTSKGFTDLPNPLKEDGELDKAAFEQMLVMVTKKKIEEKDSKPIIVWDKIRNEVEQRICDETGCPMSETAMALKETKLETLRTLFDYVDEQGILKDEARRFIEQEAQLPPAMADKILAKLHAYHYDPEQLRNMMMGMTLVDTAQKPAEEHSADELITLGKQHRALTTLARMAKDIGNPFKGRFSEEEHRIAQKIAADVPGHILHQACKDGLRLQIDVGDPSYRAGMEENDPFQNLSQRGGYLMGNPFGYSLIHLSPDIYNEHLGDHEKKPLGQTARHEFRHYWADRGNFVGHAELEQAITHDRRHFLAIADAVEAAQPDAAQQRLLADLQQALGTSDMASIRKAFESLRHVNDPWIAPQRLAMAIGDKDDDKPVGYDTKVLQAEEAFPRVDETVLEFGKSAAQFLFPSTHALMDRLDKQFMQQCEMGALPSLKMGIGRQGK